MNDSHDALVDRAVRWLKSTRGCGVVFREHTADFEHPDALGYRTGTSILVECKVSRSDFLADRRKPSRRKMALAPEDRPAGECWYLTPAGLLRAEDIPHGWGWLEAEARLVRVMKKPEPETWARSAAAYRREVYRLYCEVRRYQIHGLTYPALTKPRETPSRRSEGT